MNGSLQRIAAVARNQFDYSRARPYTVFRVVVFPIAEVLVYALITHFLVGDQGNVSDGQFIVVGSIVWILINEFQRGFTLAFFDLLWDHTLMSVWTAPVRLWEWFVGAAISSCMITGTTGVVVVTTASAFGVPMGRLGWSIVPAVVVGALLALAISILVIICVMRWGHGAAELAWGVGAMLSPLSGAFVPVSALPGFLQPIASVLPTTLIFTALREAWTGAGIPWASFGIAFAVAVMFLAFSFLALYRALARFRLQVNVTRFI
ncbi:MAG: ABC transporter permease [Acidimicrobiia bacterium]